MEELILPEIPSGDYWPGINKITFKLNNQDIDLTNSKVILQIKNNLNHPSVKQEFSTTNNLITISNNEIKILGSNINVLPGNYESKLKIILSDKRQFTIIKMIRWTII